MSIPFELCIFKDCMGIVFLLQSGHYDAFPKDSKPANVFLFCVCRVIL